MSQYIGKNISLISNSNIRYVGTLHEINSEQSTVSLKGVRSFGTEGRLGGQNEIPASDLVYEFIVFRGSDVKDLKIETPAAPAPPQPFQDPAIMNVPAQVQPAPPQASQASQAASQIPGQYPPRGYPAYGGSMSNAAYQGYPQVAQAQAQAQAQTQATAPKTAPISTPAPTETTTAPRPQAQAQPQAQPQNAQQHQQNVPGPKNNRPDHGRRPPRDKPVVGSDFDFQQSNAKFVETESTEREEVSIPPPDEFYNKKSSFFDNISSTTKEKVEGTSNDDDPYTRRAAEKELNLETFGQSHVYRPRGGRGGRGRGRGGRGRGRGGFNNGNGYRAQN